MLNEKMSITNCLISHVCEFGANTFAINARVQLLYKFCDIKIIHEKNSIKLMLKLLLKNNKNII